jgi:hypothetical protein
MNRAQLMFKIKETKAKIAALDVSIRSDPRMAEFYENMQKDLQMELYYFKDCLRHL